MEDFSGKVGETERKHSQLRRASSEQISQVFKPELVYIIFKIRLN